MAKSTIQMRAKETDGMIRVRALIKHPMETGLRKDKITGMYIPAHFITHVVAEANGDVVFSADWGASVSENPFLSFSFAGAKGETIKLTWKDNLGGSDSIEKKVSES